MSKAETRTAEQVAAELEGKAPNTADPKAVEDRDRKLRMDRRQELDDLRELLDNAAFRRFIWRLLSRLGLFRLSHTGNSETFFNEGRRNEALWLSAELANADPRALATLMIENSEALKTFGGK